MIQHVDGRERGLCERGGEILIWMMKRILSTFLRNDRGGVMAGAGQSNCQLPPAFLLSVPSSEV